MASVTFNYQAWAARFPELADAVAEPLAQVYFNETSLYVTNDTAGVIKDPVALLSILNLLTAHLAAMNTPMNGQPASPLVGRISSATQGSVTVQATLDLPPGSPQWFAQTRYGAAVWQALSPYRTMRFVPGRARNMNPWIGGYRRG